MNYLHSQSIAHWDLKNLNILLTKDLSVKIGDLGVSKILTSDRINDSESVGTPLFMAPELVRQETYSFKIDVWALGCCLYNLASFNMPFKGDS